MKWTEYDPMTGRILQAVEGVQLAKPDSTETRAVLDGVAGNGSLAYVDPIARALTVRPACSAAYSQAGHVITLRGVNLGTVVRISGDLYEEVSQDATDGSLQVTFADAGNYVLSLEQFPEHPLSASITVS